MAGHTLQPNPILMVVSLPLLHRRRRRRGCGQVCKRWNETKKERKKKESSRGLGPGLSTLLHACTRSRVAPRTWCGGGGGGGGGRSRPFVGGCPCRRRPRARCACRGARRARVHRRPCPCACPS